VGRTGTVVGCFLIEEGVPPSEVLAHLAQLRAETDRSQRVSPETQAQCDFITGWPSDEKVAARDESSVDHLSNAEDQDRFLAEATLKAAKLLERKRESFLERYLEQALVAAISHDASDTLAETTGAGRVRVPNWDRSMGGYDVVISLPGEAKRTLVVETKIDNVDETLWDLFKVIAAQSEGGIERGYLVVAATETKWALTRDCAELFSPSDVSRVWESTEMFERWSDAWANLLEGGSARPLRVPRRVRTRFLARAQIQAYPGYEVRCIGASAVEDGHWIEFDGDWPAI
jgi:hypothetical protein